MTINPEARFRLDTTTPINLQGVSGYSLALAGGELTTPIVYGQLSSAIVDDALLTVPVTTRFGLSFVAKPNHGDIFAFGSYRVSYDGSIHVRFIDEGSEVTDLASMPLADDKVSRYSFSFDGTALSVRVDEAETFIDAPAEEQITTFEILPAGGILDSIYYWSNPISSDDHRSILPTVPLLHQSDYLVDLSVEESYMTPNVQFLTTGQQGSFDDEAAGWVPYFGSDSYLIANEAAYRPGELITEVPDSVDVVGEVEITEFVDASIEVHPLLNVVTNAFGTSEHVHPIWRSNNVGTRGGVTIEQALEYNKVWRQPTPPPAGATYRWTGTPHESTSEKVVNGTVVATNWATGEPTVYTLGTGGVVERSTDRPYSGDQSFKVVAGASAGTYGGTRISTGELSYPSAGEWTWSAWVYQVDAVYGNGVQARVIAPHGQTNSPLAQVVGEWSLVSHTYNTPTEGKHQLYLVPQGVSAAEGATFYFDEPQLVSGPARVLYFDGDSPDDLANDLWLNTTTGKAHTWDSTTKQWVESASSVVSTVSFWMDPFEGEIMPGVTMTEGVVTGAAFINGLPYAGAVLKDRFMITINRSFEDLFVINPDITNLYANTVPAGQVEARALYESFFTPLTISVPSDTITVGADSTFVIDASWGIVTSG